MGPGSEEDVAILSEETAETPSETPMQTSYSMTPDPVITQNAQNSKRNEKVKENVSSLILIYFRLLEFQINNGNRVCGTFR